MIRQLLPSVNGIYINIQTLSFLSPAYSIFMHFANLYSIFMQNLFEYIAYERFCRINERRGISLRVISSCPTALAMTRLNATSVRA